MRFTLASVIAITGGVSFVVAQNTATSTSAVEAAAATALTLSPVSHVKGKAFDRFVVIYLENTDNTEAYQDPNLQALQKLGLTLTNYNAVTHPSEPNYIAAAGGDYFGLDNDNFQTIPANVATVADILEDKGIAWGAYQEDMPYSGFEGFSWVDPAQKNDYVRKHNPFIEYDSIADNKDRLAVIKNFTLFYEDLDNNKLPQYFFITPNMTNDGHDTNVTVAAKWARAFLTPLLTNKDFMQNTLVLLTFDEDETYTDRNTVFALLLGDALPEGSAGKTDGNYYNHYSQISTMESNWDLHTLGRWDVGANVFNVAVDKGCDECDRPQAWKAPPAFTDVYFNESYPGPLNSVNSSVPWPAPDVDAVKCGRMVLPSVVNAWQNGQKDTYYSDGSTVDIPDGLHPPTYGDEPEKSSPWGPWGWGCQYKPRRIAP